ncbi:cobalamin-binding protein [Seonamhaeicola sp. S2-3]|uniref:ABC transporter substrate-binding protein n=1 Tax=Seonamhaeicola sp. S2-3 TaxID=1936081 RepID=UPI0009728161|nr:helical backbone metal receptor [Seonamhaeicola sp. S2-3]APY10141.1 cobalamin-binding protein [Seonamhaeicola sp. S2-3]
MTQLKDQINRVISFEKAPKRIVSLVPSQTELLCDLGLESSIVGLTKFCVHPVKIKSKATVVGGTKQLDVEKIKALNPDVILCNKEENTKEIVEACESVCMVHVSDIFTLNDSLQLIKQYGYLFNVEEKALQICNEIEWQYKDFECFVQNKKQLKVVYFIWKNPWMVAANNTFINYLLTLNNFDNYYKSQHRYPEINLEVKPEIDLVMLSSEPYPFKEKHKKDLEAFYPNAEIVLVDGEMFSWYGSRLTKAFAYFKALRLNLC